jgi:hypothetical protein
VIVLVTGQVVTVSYVTMVVLAESPGSEEEPGRTPDGPGVVTTVTVLPVGVPPVGVFPVGVFPVGVFPVGVFPVGVFPVGVFPVGVFPVGEFSVGEGVGVATH